MSYKDTLISIGLSNNEAKIYIDLLELGSSSPSRLERHSHMHRPDVYKTLELLCSRGLVTVSPRGKRKLYVAASPDKLIDIFNKIEDTFLSGIEDLHALHNSPKAKKPSLTYAEGAQAIRDGYIDVVNSLDKGGVYYRYSPGSELFDQKLFLPKKYREVRNAKQLERFIIINEELDKNGKKIIKKTSLGKSVKSVPRSFDLFNDRIGLVVYADKVLIVDYESKSAITIHHAKFAQFQKKIFKLLFSKL